MACLNCKLCRNKIELGLTSIPVCCKIITEYYEREAQIHLMKPLQEKAYEYIKNLILEESFQYNTIYSETKISKEIGVSRTPMRDALRRLEQERYIDIIPSKGFCIHQMAEQDIIETFQIRSAIEGYCTAQITKEYQEENSQKLIRELEFLLEKQKKILEDTGSISSFVEYDNKFHIEIVSHFNNQTFNELFGSYLFQIKQLAILSLGHPGRMAETIEEHTAILQAMKSGDLTGIYPITMKHMETPKGINLSDFIAGRLN